MEPDLNPVTDDNQAPKASWSILPLFGLLMLKSSIISIVVTSFVPLAAEFGLSRTQLGLLTSGYYFTSFVGTIVWTLAMAKLSRKRVLVVGGTMWACGLCATSLVPSYGGVFALFLVTGLGVESTTLTVLAQTIATAQKSHRGRKMSLFWVVNGLGSVLGSLLAGTLEGIYLMSWRNILFGIGFAALALLVFIGVTLPWSAPDRQYVDTVREEVDYVLKPLKDDFSFDLVRESFHNRVNVLLVIIAGLFFPVNVFNNIWLQRYWIDEHALTQAMASISFIFTSAGEFLGLVVGGYWVDKSNRRGNYRKPLIGAISVLVAAPFFFLGISMMWQMDGSRTGDMNYVELCLYMFQTAMASPSIFTSYVSLFLGYFFLTMMSPLFLVIVVDCNSPRTRTLMLNFAIIVYNTSWFVGPVLGGYIGDLLSLQVTLFIPPVAYLATGFLYLYLQKIAPKWLATGSPRCDS